MLSIENCLIRFIKIGIRKTMINWLKLVTPFFTSRGYYRFLQPRKGSGEVEVRKRMGNVRIYL